jgi:hypothetical protein
MVPSTRSRSRGATEVNERECIEGLQEIVDTLVRRAGVDQPQRRTPATTSRAPWAPTIAGRYDIGVADGLDDLLRLRHGLRAVLLLTCWRWC